MMDISERKEYLVSNVGVEGKIVLRRNISPSRAWKEQKEFSALALRGKEGLIMALEAREINSLKKKIPQAS